MSKFRVGDRIMRTAGSTKSVKQNMVYSVVQISPRQYSPNVRLKGISGLWDKNNFKLMVSGKQEKPDKSHQWSFQVNRHIEIDKALIMEDLSSKQPVALIQSSTGKCSVLYHHSLLDKAKALLAFDEPPEVDKIEDFAKVITWAKKVRAIPWKSEKKRITVSLPTI